MIPVKVTTKDGAVYYCSVKSMAYLRRIQPEDKLEEVTREELKREALKPRGAATS